MIKYRIHHLLTRLGWTAVKLVDPITVEVMVWTAVFNGRISYSKGVEILGKKFVKDYKRWIETGKVPEFISHLFT